ncbi:hypothetical protein P278_05650 [Zhouia amylolytica AD3]|uniref:Insertion element IS150 protein InsJ-like helix-turn-helix domain-containing protein n=2 Tax=Zhouia amylolytica TaxID=376730 RepID=W2UT28_9FLAO|nr:hypothetical protein P278_05650 [Zhouia amylolytica AD3]
MDEILAMVKENKDGKSIQAIAKKFDIDKKTLYHWIVTYG